MAPSGAPQLKPSPPMRRQASCAASARRREVNRQGAKPATPAERLAVSRMPHVATPPQSAQPIPRPELVDRTAHTV
jgi:hypothetical protein